jgi:hypothetical protein
MGLHLPKYSAEADNQAYYGKGDAKMKSQKQVLWLAMLYLALWTVMAPVAYSQVPNSQGAQQTMIPDADDLFAEVGARVPAFGGMFVNEDKNTLYVYIVPGQPGDIDSLEEAVTDVFGPQQQQTEMITAQYTFLQLKEWHDRMIDVLSIPGVVLTDIDHFKNRLTVGVESPDVAAEVEGELMALGIPLAAVNMEQMAPAEPDQTLESGWRPLVGGIQITNSRPILPGECTLGFTAIRKGVHGFVTNSHCTNVQGAGAGTLFTQPGGGTPVGVVTVDPCYGPAPGCPEHVLFHTCPSGRVCRLSDSAFAQINVGTGGILGRIARPTFNAIAWNGVDHFTITRPVRFPLAGLTVQKVGIQTGWTQGTINRTCARTNLAGTNITLLCQKGASYSRAEGDSGAPVFGITDLATWSVTLVGIHWGGATPTQGFFSPLGQVESIVELGGLIVCPFNKPTSPCCRGSQCAHVADSVELSAGPEN